MSNDVGLNLLNTLIGGLTESKKSDGKDVVEADVKIRIADPRRIAQIFRALSVGESEPDKEEKYEYEGEEQEMDDEPLIRGISAGVRMPEATIAQGPVPSEAPMPMAGSKIDAATRQMQDFAPAEEESPVLIPNNITAPPDYNPEYQEQFDRYLRTRQFDQMYGPALKGYGAPMPTTPQNLGSFF